MIVREILNDPSLIERFDFANDTKDTLHWLRMLDTPEADAISDRLREAATKWADKQMIERLNSTRNHKWCEPCRKWYDGGCQLHGETE